MLKLIRSYPQVLSFGILATFFSSVGQTFLVSLFIPAMREDFGMSRTLIAGLYSTATVVSALLLPLMGRLIDRVRLVYFMLWCGVFLALGCVILSHSQTLITVLVGFILVRNLGQGAMVMSSSTTMARVFGPFRGKALSIASLGYPLGEALFPLVVTGWIFAHGWRSGWIFLAVLTLVFFAPAVFMLIRNDPHERARQEFDKDTPRRGQSPLGKISRSFSLKDVLRDIRFYLLIIPVVVPPGLLTALFFHHGSLAEWKGWSLKLISTGFIAFAFGRGILSFSVGPFIDRLTARRIVPFTLLPLAFGIPCFIWGENPIWVFVYLAGAGATTGLGMTVSAALWAELYGTRNLGSIKGFQSSLVVLSTAVTPLIVGYFLDSNVHPSLIMVAMIAILLFGALLAYIALFTNKETITEGARA